MRGPKALLAAGDVLCFVVFALIGLRSHDEGIGAGSLARVAGPFAVSWLASAWLNGLYRPRPHSAGSTTRLVLRAWLPAWLAGLAIRALFFGKSPFTAFSIIALLFNAALLSGWRLGASLLDRPPRAETTPERARYGG